MLRALTCVHDVIVFENETPELLLKGLYLRGDGPRWVVKGEEYRVKPIPERELIEQNGGEIIFAPTTPGKSTTQIWRTLNDSRHR
jgi:D-beta-D-heptose 7-phosphate kinase/D-beta-D-heptose 1-phosphate adenosyltransferase